MKPIKLYFAGSTNNKSVLDEIRLGITNRLLTFQYENYIDIWFKANGDSPGNIIIDSGAFTVWNKGKVIDLTKYIEFAHKIIEKGEQLNKKIFIVNLDVIPGNVGETKKLNSLLGSIETIQKNKDIIENAAKKGYMNMKTMIENGITPIHVFHQGEHWKWLDRAIDKTNYIGISPANDVSTKDKKKWIYSVFEYLYKNNIEVNTHGFAVWVPSLLKELPWTSCDAASWKLAAAWGKIFYCKNGFSDIFNKNLDKEFSIYTVSDKSFSSKKELSLYSSIESNPESKLDSFLLEQLKKDGYSYEDLQTWQIREEINIRFFLMFEKWLNLYKKDKEFKTNHKLIYHEF